MFHCLPALEKRAFSLHEPALAILKMKNSHRKPLHTLVAFLIMAFLALTGCTDSSVNSNPLADPTTTTEPLATNAATTTSEASAATGPIVTTELAATGSPTTTTQASATNAPTTTTEPPVILANTPVVITGDVSFTVELAETSQQKGQGLSDRESLADGAGMIFLYDDEARHTFWMNKMHFPLDMLWIGSNCTVADISAQVPPPDPTEANPDLPLYSPNAPVRHVLEINGGAAAVAGISIGDAVRFGGSLEGRYGC
jgi:hypothetical protein